MNTTSPNEHILNIENLKATILSDTALRKINSSEYIQLHFHYYFELFYVTSGTLTITFESHELVLKGNDLLIIPPRVLHVVKSSSEGIMRYNINFNIEKNGIKSAFKLYEKLTSALHKPYVFFNNVPTVDNTLSNLCAAIVQNNKYTISMHFHEFIIAILGISDELSVPALLDAAAFDSNMTRIYKIHNVINRNFTSKLSIKQIADMLFLSTRQVNRIIQQYYGKTFRELITQMRMNAASALLSETDMKISTVSAKVGYNSVRGFYTAFRKYYGCLPSEYSDMSKNDPFI